MPRTKEREGAVVPIKGTKASARLSWSCCYSVEIVPRSFFFFLWCSRYIAASVRPYERPGEVESGKDNKK